MVWFGIVPTLLRGDNCKRVITTEMKINGIELAAF